MGLTFTFSSSCGICPIYTTREQAPRNGVLELELEDVEKLDKTKGGTTTLRAEHRHEKSVTAAYWDPRGRSIVSTSYDDVLRSTSPFAEWSCMQGIPIFSPHSRFLKKHGTSLRRL